MTQPHTVDVTRYVEAFPETVFKVITTPEGFSAWMDGEAEFEAVSGRPFVIRFPQFAIVMAGTVLEVVADRLLVMTWGVAEGPQADSLPAGSTTVRVELKPEGDGTQVTLTQSMLPADDDPGQHEAGWRFHLSRLQLRANQAQLAGPLEAAVAAWCSAWSERDEALRVQQLADCCVEGVRYADDYTALEGRSMLAAHVGGTLHHVGYAQLSPDGPTKICRGEVLMPWRGTRDDGSVAFQGTLHARVGTDGKFTTATSFWDHVELG